MNETLKKVGLALIIFGVIDIGVMIYCILSGINYESSFNIFALVGGIFLVQKNIKAARIVGFFSGFMLGGFVGVLIIFPALFPMALIKTFVRITPLSEMMLEFFWAIFLVSFTFWIYKSLTSKPVLEAIEEHYHGNVPRLSAKRGVPFGLFLAISLFFMTTWSFRGEVSDKVIEMARKKMGESYLYQITSLSFSRNSSGANYSATVIAYDENSIQSIDVEWAEK